MLWCGIPLRLFLLFPFIIRRLKSRLNLNLAFPSPIPFPSPFQVSNWNGVLLAHFFTEMSHCWGWMDGWTRRELPTRYYYYYNCIITDLYEAWQTWRGVAVSCLVIHLPSSDPLPTTLFPPSPFPFSGNLLNPNPIKLLRHQCHRHHHISNLPTKSNQYL